MVNTGIKTKNKRINGKGKMVTENEYAHWLFNVPGMGKKSIEKVLCSGMTCKEVYEASEREFKGLLTEKTIKSLSDSRKKWDFESEKNKLSQKGIIFVSRIDRKFPDKLKNIPDAPFAIYYKGKLPDPDTPSVAIIGARICSDYGRYMARNFGRGLALAGVQIISGMARGIDGVSQKAAVEAGGMSYGILGNGVDVCYPEENMDVYRGLCKNGGIISEYPPGTLPKAGFFPMRNRIISGLADIVLVIEAREKSGTQITVDTALEQGREVLAVPGRVTDRLSDGCNALISQGAGVAICIEDILDRLDKYTVYANKNGTKHQGDGATSVNFDINRNCEEDSGEDDACGVKEISIEDTILEGMDVIPVSMSQIMDYLYNRNIDISIPQVMGYLMELTYSGKVIQDGAYYRRRIPV